MVKTNVTYERYKFNWCSQNCQETVENVYVRLRSLASTCEFGSLTDELVRDRLVVGISDENVRKRVLQEPSLTLSTCLDICRAHESSKLQGDVMQAANDPVAHTVHKYPQAQSRQSHKPQKPQNTGRFKGRTQVQPNVIDCRFCGQKHARDKNQCPTLGKRCNKCQKLNHFASMCNQRSRQVHEVDCSDEQDLHDDEECIVVTLSGSEVNQISDSKYAKKIMVSVVIDNEETVAMQVDSGSTCNVIPRKHVPTDTVVEDSKQVLTMYNKDTMPINNNNKLHLYSA